MKGTKLGMVAIDGVCHMIGQTEDIFKRGATMAEIAMWLNVSKPTAKRFIEANCQSINVEMVDWRKGHSVQYRYSLTPYAKGAYKRNVYYTSYRMLVAAMFGDILA